MPVVATKVFNSIVFKSSFDLTTRIGCAEKALTFHCCSDSYVLGKAGDPAKPIFLTPRYWLCLPCWRRRQSRLVFM